MVSKQHDEAGPSRIALSKKKGLPELLGRVIALAGMERQGNICGCGEN
jgi:hypothetical protein